MVLTEIISNLALVTGGIPPCMILLSPCELLHGRMCLLVFPFLLVT